MLNYERDVQIDEQSLELEWLDQAELSIKYGREWARIKSKVAALDEKVKVIRSELIRKAWDDPVKYLGQPKGVVQTVEAFYRTHKKHKKIKQEFIEAQEELDLAEIAKNEMSFTRKAAMENLTKLFISDYFAGPSIPGNITERRKDRDKERMETNKQMKKVKRVKK